MDIQAYAQVRDSRLLTTQLKKAEFMKKIIIIIITLFCLSAHAGDQKFYAKIPPKSSGSTESGALLFTTPDSLNACFLKVFSSSNPDFKLCESSASAILPVGVELQVLKKFDKGYYAQVKVLSGQHKDKVGHIHEMYIDPSPWKK